MASSWTHCQERFSFLEFYADSQDEVKPRRSASAPAKAKASRYTSPPNMYMETLAERASKAEFLAGGQIPSSAASTCDSSSEEITFPEPHYFLNQVEEVKMAAYKPNAVPQGKKDDIVSKQWGNEESYSDKQASGLSKKRHEARAQQRMSSYWEPEHTGSANEFTKPWCIQNQGQSGETKQAQQENIFAAEQQGWNLYDALNEVEEANATSVMICNVPCRVSLANLVEAIDYLGFANTYNFVHLPSPKSRQNVGYGFVNFLDPSIAQRFMKAYEGYQFPGRKSLKVGATRIARIQGAENYMKFKQVAKRSYFPPVANFQLGYNCA